MSAGALPPEATPLEASGHKEADLAELGRLLGEGQVAATVGSGGHTSDLSLDEILLLHAVGLEPAEVVFGVGATSIAQGAFTWATGEVTDGYAAFEKSFDSAKEAIRSGCNKAKGVGVLGVEVEIELTHHRAIVIVTGTAVRPVSDGPGQQAFKVGPRNRAFLSDLSARDFVVLSRAGWYPLDLVAGASFVHAPRRSMGTAIGQATQNVELSNFTQTLYQAREQAMERLQSHITAAGGAGLVDVKIIDRPLHFASHVVEFVAYGTAIKLMAASHTHPVISPVVPVDDAVRTFEASSLVG
ncbi:MAG TPA: heavy metal-binding domain-containing protein [Acidimicrobiales bacterium]|nr:heavy metal-binding domain-containing protein [Acidimicrobiales bacterium]